MASPIAPGATFLDADDLASDQEIDILIRGPQSAKTTLGNLAQFFELSNDVQNTAIATAGAGTLTAAAIAGGLIFSPAAFAAPATASLAVAVPEPSGEKTETTHPSQDP